MFYSLYMYITYCMYTLYSIVGLHALYIRVQGSSSLWYCLVSLLDGGCLQLKYSQPRLSVVVIHSEMIHSVHLSPQLLSDWVKGAVVVNLCCQVVPCCQVLEAVEVVPVTSPTSAGIVIHNLVGWGGV